MEELRSTEILDLEIENDAKKKAEKVLSDAKAEEQTILADVESRIKEAETNLKNNYKEKISRFENNLKASVPLEKRRFLVDFYYTSVSKAINEYLKSLSQDKILEVLNTKLKECAKNFQQQKFTASVFGLELAEAKKMLKTSLADGLLDVQETSFELSGDEACPGNEIHSGMILETQDKSIKLRVTMDQVLRELRENKNYELTTALFDGRLPE